MGNSSVPVELADLTAPAARLATAVGGPIAGIPWGIVLVLVVLQLAATAVWRVYRSPELMERWLEIWDEHRDKTP